MVWAKNRSATGNNVIADTTRGTYSTLFTNLTNAASGSSYIDFSSTGFSVINSGSWNVNNNNFASWTFREAPKFFDVVTYTGNDTARDIAHSLGVAPGMIIIKTLNAASNWFVWHRSLDNKITFLESTAAAVDATGYYFGSASTQTATTFRVLASGGNNASGNTYVAYLFAHDTTADGIVQCGSYTGAYPSTVTVNLGWEPQYILVKNASRASDWGIFDVMRGMPLGDCNTLAANSAAAENGVLGQAPAFKATPTGFIVDSGLTAVNVSGDTHIYMAIRRGPMRTPTDATKVFNVLTRSGTGAAATISSGFPVDMIIGRKRTAPAYTGVVDRLRGFAPQLSTQQTVAEVNDTTAITAMGNTTVSVGDDSYNWGGFNQGSQSYAPWMFRRAPGFFDVVCYTGTGSARTVSHNLAVAPELMIFKSRNTNSTNWAVLSQMTSTTYSYGTLQTSNTFSTGKTYGSGGSPNFEELSAAPTASVINIASSAELNASGRTFVAYLFSSCPGVSKVGTYSGTGATQNIDCGFSNGARFVLIRAINDATNWLVFDSARGIVSGNDPVLLLNSTDAEYTSYNAINPYSPGFTLPASNLTNQVNVNYLYLAIA